MTTNIADTLRVASEDQESTPQIMKILKFNSKGLPIGPGAGTAAILLGKLVRTQIPIRFKRWTDPLLKERKDLMWKEYKKSYNFTDAQKVVMMRKAGAAWKKHKATLRKLLKGSDIQRWMDAIPKKGVRPEDWLAFCQHENTPGQKAIRERNKRVKNNCVRKSTHNTGRYGYAQAEQNFKDANQGRNPLRVELWLYTHERKGGGYSPDNVEFARKLEGLLEVMLANNGIETMDSGPLFDTFGVDKGGSTRCVGSTVSRKAMLASSFARQMLEEVDLERVEWKEEMKSMKSDLLSQMKELTEGLRHGDFSSNGQKETMPSTTLLTNHSLDAGCTSQFAQPIPCKVMSHTGTIVAYGVKVPLGSATVLDGHVMRPREAKVLLDQIVDSSYPVWGGEQDGAKTLGEVLPGTFLYWHDDFLPIQ